jgi:hypothetical protein
MIRRDARTVDGSPIWVLVSQVDHAHLAGELANDWREELPCRDVLLPTIDRHDDGWRMWERSPTIDPATGHPRSFLEMPNAIAHDLWRRSIAGVEDLGPLAQYIVAEHFCRLRRSGDAHIDANVDDFLREFIARGQAWLAQWQAERPTLNTADIAEAAVDWLQFFDRFSLWLCMAERHALHELALPNGTTLKLEPLAVAGETQVMRVTPWPWRSESRELVVTGIEIPARQLPSNEELRRELAAGQRKTLRWRFVRR